MVTIEGAKDGKTEEMEVDVVLVCVGRRPYTNNLGLEEVALLLTEPLAVGRKLALRSKRNIGKLQPLRFFGILWSGKVK